ncbi:serine/threonine-protein kinase [Actinosynnema sp. ALI-1.44]|uniref:serine/threonine-protein kinase n=1 Tax=Actinosynnema sp. ALI-1.44 TaxID=1933779 RepID=UPI001177D3AE|nr:serine/threonine-protein kinase [Actinosynnema sp. ALI-1.44]
MTQGEGRVVAKRYRLVAAIGRGGMGVVWRAHDEFLHRDVAIKELRLNESADPSESEPAARRVLREARAAAQLRHPGIVTVHDVVTDDGLPWIVMELIEGRSLADILDHDGPLPVEEVAHIGMQVLRALDAAHQRGILHRDVKPGNIMLDGDRVVLTDFGIALIDGASALTGTGQMPGSPEYIAPERIDGQEATTAADMWSVGVTLYGAVVGRSPFKRKDIQSTLAAAASRDPDPDKRIGRLWPVIQGLLRKPPAERMTAVAAIDRLSTIAATLTPRSGTPQGGTPRVVAPPDEVTWIDNAASQVTDVHATAPNTRTAPPPLMPLHAPATPGDVTLDPVPVRPRTRKNGLLLGLGAAFVVAVVVVVITLAMQSPPQGQQQSPQGPATAEPSPVPELQLHKEKLGFEIQVPKTWTRSESQPGAQSDVIWNNERLDPGSGAMQVQVRRDDAKARTPLVQYLSVLNANNANSRDNLGYTRIALEDNGKTADLEYAYTTASGGTVIHALTRAFSDDSGRLYLLTVTLYAGSAKAEQDGWRTTRPVRDAVLGSFRITS